MSCNHLAQIKIVKPKGDSCLDCEKEKRTPVQLRACLTCGNVGCCDSSSGKHAAKHFNDSMHPVMQEIRGKWKWCYVDKEYV